MVGYSFENTTINYGRDEFDFRIPTSNWITKKLCSENGIGYSGIELTGDDVVLPDSMIHFLRSEKREWPIWLPVIVHEIENPEKMRVWNPERDIGVINEGEHDPNPEVVALKNRVEEAGFN